MCWNVEFVRGAIDGAMVHIPCMHLDDPFPKPFAFGLDADDAVGLYMEDGIIDPNFIRFTFVYDAVEWLLASHTENEVVDLDLKCELVTFEFGDIWYYSLPKRSTTVTICS